MLILNKRIRVFFRAISFCILFFVIYFFVGLAIVDDDSSTRLKFHEFYEQQRIDAVVIGASRANMGFDATLADELLGVKTFNLATASQTCAGSYYILKELINRYDVKTVFLDAEYALFYGEPDVKKANWIISDYMKGYVKYQYIFDVFDEPEWLNMVSRVCRYRDKIGINWCKRNLKAKLCKEYWSYSRDNSEYSNYLSYQDKGLYVLPKENHGMDFFVYRQDYSEFDKISKTENSKQMDYFYKSIQLCKKKGIDVVLVTFPESQFYLLNAGNYKIFFDKMQKITDEYDIKWIDLNRIENEIFEDYEFSNLDHLTRDGARHCTSLLCKTYTELDKIDYIDNPVRKGNSDIIGVTYKTEHSIDGVVVSWNVETYEKMKLSFRIIGYDESNNIVIETDIIDDDSIEIEALPKEMYIEVFDSYHDKLGIGKFM